MPTALILTAPQAMTAPMPGTPKLKIAGDVLTISSDRFTGNDTASFDVRTSDAKLGGEPLPYSFQTAGGWGIKNEQLVRGTVLGSTTLMLKLPATRSQDVTVSCRIAKLPPTGSLTVIPRRDVPGGGATSQVRATIFDGKVSLYVVIGGTQTQAAAGRAIAAGDTLAVREYRGLVQMLINGDIAGEASYSAGTFTGDYAGLSFGGDDSGFAVDDLQIVETIH